MLSNRFSNATRIFSIVLLAYLTIGCDTGEGPDSIEAQCTDTGSISFSFDRYLSNSTAEIIVIDTCKPLEAVNITVSNGTDTVNIGVLLDGLSTGNATLNLGSTTNDASDTLSVSVGDALVAKYTDSNGNKLADAADITAELAVGVFSETNTDPVLPVAEIINRVAGGKDTVTDTQSVAVTAQDGVFSLEAIFDSALQGDDLNGFVFSFGPPRLLNRGFESPNASTADISCSDAWSCFNFGFTVSNNFKPGGPGTFASPGAHGGTQLLKQFGFDAGAISSSIPANAGQAVNASAYAMSWEGDAFKNLVLLQLRFFSANPALDSFGNPIPISVSEVFADSLGNQAYQLLPQDGGEIEDWTLMEVTGVAPLGTVRADVLLLHLLTPPQPGSGSIFWDDLSLTVGDSTPGENISAFDVLRFSVNTSAAGGLKDLEVKLEDASAAGASVFLSNYTSTPSTVAGWEQYEIPLADFLPAGLDFTAITSLGFFNASSTITGSATVAPTLLDATLYFDDINFATGAALPPVPAPILTGKLVDSPIQGVSFSTVTQSGVTNADGEFDYLAGEMVTFSIGNIELGVVEGASIITPVELTGSADPTVQIATNVLVFLQSIDADGDPTNGITISAATQTAALSQSLVFTEPGFSTQIASVVAAIEDPADPDKSVISEATALDNFYLTYADLGGTKTFLWLFPGKTPVGEPGYDLVFSDEFNVDGTPSPANWTIETGYGPGDPGWGNNEWQLYTTSPNNIKVVGGDLVITADCPIGPCGVRNDKITSGKVNTLGSFSFRYGKAEARLKAPVGKASWPAFWMLGVNFPDIGWPMSGEIDVMELFQTNGSNPNTTHTAIHWCDDSKSADPCTFENGWVFFSQGLELTESLGDDYHVYSVEWNENSIKGFIDGVPYFEKAIDPATMDEFRKEFYLILNVAMGGTLGSNQQPPNGSEVWPQIMLVDYVRVYQLTGDPTATFTIGSAANTTIDATDASGVIADGLNFSEITIQAIDGKDVPLTVSAGVVTLDVTGSATVSNITDNDDGTYTARVTNTVAEPVTITGTIAGKAINDSATVTFLAGAASGANTTMGINDADGIVVAGEDVTITIVAFDGNNNPITTVSAGAVTLDAVSDSGKAVITTSPAAEGPDGTYTATVTNTVAEIVTITGRIDGELIDTVDITFTHGPVDPSKTTITASPTIQESDGTPSEITVEAKDQFGNKVTSISGGTVELFEDGVSGNAVIGTVIEGPNGTYKANVSNITAESVDITGKIGGVDITGAESVATITFKIGAVSAANTTMDIDDLDGIVEAGQSVTITIVAFDGNNNPITTVSAGQVTLEADSTDVVITSSPAAESPLGTYTATVTNTVAELVTITGRIGNALIDTVDITFTHGPVDPSKTTITVDFDEVNSDGVAASTITVLAKDQFSNNVTSVSGGTVELFEDGVSGNAVITSTPASEGPNGTYTATVSNETAESVDITGEIGGVPITGAESVATVTFVGPSELTTTITAVATAAVDNGSNTSIQSTVTVQAKDLSGNNFAGGVSVVDLEIIGSATATFVPSGTTTVTATNNTDGTYTAYVTNTVVEEVTITGTIDTNSITSGDATVLFGNTVGVTSQTNIDSTLIPSDSAFNDPNCDVAVTLLDDVPDATYAAYEGDVSSSASGLTLSPGGTGNCVGIVMNFGETVNVNPAALLTGYTQDFESLDATDAAALGTDSGEGFAVFADVWGSAAGDATIGTDIFLYSYGPFTAPNGGAGFSAIATNGEGGPAQGDQYLNVYSDYDQTDQTGGGSCGPTNGCTINTSVFRETTLIADDLGGTWTFTFDAKSPFTAGIFDGTAANGNGGDFNNPQSASAFIKTLDPSAGFNTTNDIRVDMTNVSNTDWATFSISIDLTDPLLAGQLLQFGFNTVSTEYGDSGVYYDNICFASPRCSVNVNGYETLKFALDTSGVTGDAFSDMELSMEDASGGNASVFLSNYTAVPANPAIAGADWQLYEIPLVDFTGSLDKTIINKLTFSDPSSTVIPVPGPGVTPLVGTIRTDDIHFIVTPP